MRTLVFRLLMVALVAGGCGGLSSSEQRDYAERNLAAFATLPAPPGTRKIAETSNGYSEADTSGPPIGVDTHRVFKLADGMTPREFVAFYARRTPRGWTVVDDEHDSDGTWVNLRSGDAYVHVMANGRVGRVKLDHHCYRDEEPMRCWKGPPVP